MSLPIPTVPYVQIYPKGDRQRPPVVAIVTEPSKTSVLVEVQAFMPRSMVGLKIFEHVRHVNDPALKDPRVRENISATWEEWRPAVLPQPASPPVKEDQRKEDPRKEDQRPSQPQQQNQNQRRDR